MKTLTLYELGKDPLPKEGCKIYYQSSHSGFGGMFSQHTLELGSVQYLYGDFATSLEEAFEKGGSVCYGEQSSDDSYDIPICVGSEYLSEGALWCYEEDFDNLFKEKV